MQLLTNKQMVVKLITGESLWMLNEVEQCQTGDLEDWVGVWDQPEWVEMKLIKNILDGKF